MEKYIRESDAVQTVMEKPDMTPDEKAGIIRRLKGIPAADVATVRHGRWIKDGEDGPVYCSECGEEHEWEDYRASYCDTCGAKMDGGQDE